MFRRNKPENKAKLEHKLYLARENPEPIFDLSECDLNNVPPGIYSLCRVFLKEVLKLDHNNLTSLSGGGQLKELHLLKVLHLQNNCIKTLPDDISLLKSLTELNLSENKLKTLPESITQLENLVILDVSNNILKTLPQTLGNLIKLKQLSIRGNPNVQHLPKSICNAQRLVTLDVDVENLLYPPRHVAEEGIASIMSYICNDTGCFYTPPENVEETEEVDRGSIPFENDHFHAKIWELEKIKQQRVQDFLEIEKYNETLQKREFELASSQKTDRNKVKQTLNHEANRLSHRIKSSLSNYMETLVARKRRHDTIDDFFSAIVEDQKRFDSKLNKIQVEKETERFKLIEQLQEAEQNADLAVNQLLALGQLPMEQLLQQEKIEEERLLSAVNRYNETLRKDDILNAMRDILTQETKRFNQNNLHREENNKSILEQELQLDTKLISVLQDQDAYKCELIAKLQEDSELQKALVGTLLERSDARSWSLTQQVRLVESQLGALTVIEMERKKLQMDQHLTDLCQKRTDLSYLLMDLLAQQKERRNQLLSTLQSMEDERNENIDDFWLRQYQRLLDKMPDSLLTAQMNFDPALSQALLMNGVIHCLPFLAKVTQSVCDTRCITEDDLIETGIHDRADRVRILDAFQVYEKTSKTAEVEAVPSAPELPMEEASAPLPDNIHSISTSECVICMENDCAVIFVPCGHLCCCSKCSTEVVKCPLCRSVMQHKISLSC